MLMQTIGKQPNSPCYKCEKREPGCHGKCEIYASWKVQYTEKMESEAQERTRANFDVRASLMSTSKQNRLKERRKK